ncbi:MAG: hypothetical protein D6708_02400 [Candidatus Dadabacteria bacterium]|nr:MAG: hypothetical protein D6708_02400 [Candidatus Dadabacteria bacterium]
MDEPIRDEEEARRLARTIVSDLAAYHKAEVERGIVEDRLFEILAPAIAEGRRHYEERVSEDLWPRGYYEKALVDFLLRPFGKIKSRIW